MISRFTRSTAVLVALAASAIAPATAGAVAPTPITSCPYTITSPGAYAIAADLNCAGGNGLNVFTSDASIAFNGHTLTNTYIGADIYGSNVSFTGPGGLVATSYGFYIESGSNSGADGVTVSGSYVPAGTQSSGSGNYIRNSDLRNNDFGPHVFAGSMVISGNDCSGFHQGGIFVLANSTVQNNVCSNGTGRGITTNNGGNVITGNTATNDTDYDGYDPNPNCGTNQWSGNLFGDFNQACVNNSPMVVGPVCTITGTAGNDRLRGTSGDDVICGLGGDDVLDGRGGNDEVYGNDGNDTVIGKGGNDKLVGGAGTDLLLPGAGNDTADGGDGTRDRVLYSDITGGGVNVFLASGAVSPEAGSNVGSDTLSNIEQVFGSEFDDILVAQIAGVASTVKGGGGDDHLDTDDGDGLDAMVGNAGSDICTGNPGDRISEC
jgi:Ca2+-binding RTX toxin-like protein